MLKFISIFLIIFSITKANAFSKPIEQQLHDLYNKLQEPKGDDRTENSTYMVLESLHTAYISYNVVRKNISKPFVISGRNIVISKNLPETWITKGGKVVPVDGLIAQIASVIKVYKNYGLKEKFAVEFAFRIQKEIIEALGATWKEYEDFLIPQLRKSGMNVSGEILSDEALLTGLKEVKKLIAVSRDFDIPYLAGYAANNPKVIYIDSGMKAKMTGRFGVVDLADFLIIHEVTEKLLIDEWSFKKDIYVHTHQFAQRLEKEMVEANGLSWNIYQGDVMEKEIHRAEDPNRIFTRTPEDLDLTPYLEYKDKTALTQIHENAVNFCSYLFQ